MTAVGEWLKQIILIVILATMADLLLPTKAMQKYVRVVMGLAVIAAMLQPLVPFFKGDWADQMANAAWQESTTTGPAPATATDAALEKVMSSQEQLEENRYADPSLERAIASQFSCRVDAVTLTGTGLSGSPLRVHVTIGATLAQTTKQKIRAFVAGMLQLPLDQVSVEGSDGGNSSGL